MSLKSPRNFRYRKKKKVHNKINEAKNQPLQLKNKNKKQ